MKNSILLLLTCIVFSISGFANKHALIIAVGNYDKDTHWSNISSVNDVPLIKQALLDQNFPEKNITTLLNEQATYDGIIKAIKDLQSRINPGDVVVIHYSGHGQQIVDNDNEEADEKDEALVPYNAGVRYTSTYQGQNHLRDDEIGRIIANFRNDLQQDGQLLLLLDSCHSGSSTRGGVARGSQSVFAPEGWTPSNDTSVSEGSDMFEQEEISSSAAPFVLISGASADELNYEYDGYGSLSFAFSKAMSELGSDFTYRQLFSKISSIMNVISPNQTPTIEGDVDYKLFKGDYVQQEPYYQVASILSENVIKIQSGKFHGIFEGTTISVMPEGSQQYDEDKVIATGEVKMAKYNEANIVLNEGQTLPDTNEKNYWVFINERTYADISIKVYMDESVNDDDVMTEIESFLDKNNLGEIVANSASSEVTISKNGSAYELNITSGLHTVAAVDKNRGSDAVDNLKEKLFNYAQGQYLKKLDIKNPNYEFSFRLLPLAYDVVMEKYGDTISADSFVNKSGVFQVRAKKDKVVLEVTNKSESTIYFSIIEINSLGEITTFLPNNKCKLNDDERMLEPGKSMVFSQCLYSFAPPYEKIMLKGFASDKPINFQSTVSTRGAGTRSNSNPLEAFVGGTYAKSRGSEATEVSGKIDGYSAELIYEIVK